MFSALAKILGCRHTHLLSLSCRSMLCQVVGCGCSSPWRSSLLITIRLLILMLFKFTPSLLFFCYLSCLCGWPLRILICLLGFLYRCSTTHERTVLSLFIYVFNRRRLRLLCPSLLFFFSFFSFRYPSWHSMSPSYCSSFRPCTL